MKASLLRKSANVGGLVFAVSTALASFATGAVAAGGVTREGNLTKFTLPAVNSASDAGIDYKNAKPMPLPRVSALAGSAANAATLAYPGPPGSVSGQPGSWTSETDDGGTGKRVAEFDRSGRREVMRSCRRNTARSNHPFTTSRVDTALYPVSRSYPYRPLASFSSISATGTYLLLGVLDQERPGRDGCALRDEVWWELAAVLYGLEVRACVRRTALRRMALGRRAHVYVMTSTITVRIHAPLQASSARTT